MEFPVDILATVDPESLEQSAKDYMSKLLYRNSEKHDYLSIPGSKKIEIGLCNVSFVPLYGVDIKQKVLALFSPEEPFKAVGLYLLDQWWSAEDILKTADSSRTGLIKVKAPGERIVLYVLNRIIYRTKEMARDDVPFLCHGEDEIAKILWKNGEAVGFYSVKPEGRLCNSFLTQCYQLPVMDTIFIRKCHRGNGYGLQMLEDFIKSFKKDLIGLKYPLSPAMYKVCKKYLSRYPEDKELLCEIEGVGSPFQRTQIDKKLKAMHVKGNHQFMGKLNFDTEDRDIQMEAGITQERETMTEYTEVVEEVVQIKITKEMQDMAVLTHGRSSNLKHKKHLANIEETTEKITRVEDIQPVVQCVDAYLVHEDGTLSSNSKEPELKDTVETMTHDVTPKSEITHLHCEEQNNLTPKPTHQSEMEKEQVVEITPVMAIQSLKGNEGTQFMKTFEATIIPVNLQPLELQQVVEVEIKRSSETETVEVKEIKDVNNEIPLDRREPSEEIKEPKRAQTEMEETANKEDVEDKLGMGKLSVFENIVDDGEEVEVEKKKAGTLEVSLVEKQQSEQVKKRDTVDKTDMVQDCLCEKEQETNDAEENVEGKVPELSAAEHAEEQEAEPASEMVPAETVQSTEEATSTLKLQKVVVHVDLDNVSITHTDVSEDAKGTSQPENTNHREGKEADRLTQKVEPTEKKQEEEMTENENVTVNVMDKIQNNNMEEREEMMETERVMTMDVERVSELTIDENKMEEFQEEKTLKETKTLKDTPGDKITNKDIIESSEDYEGVKSDAQTVLYEEDKTLLWRSSRLKHQATESELTKSVLMSSAKTAKATSKSKAIKQQVKFQPPLDDTEVEQLKEVVESHTGTAVEEKIESVSITTKDCSEYMISALNDVEQELNVDEEHLEDKVPDYQAIMEVENKTEDSSQDENKVGTMLSNEDQEKTVVDKTSEDEKIAVVDVHDAEGKSPQLDFAETVEEQQEDPASETVPTEEDDAGEATSTPKLQNVAVLLVDFNKVPAKLESDDSEMDRRTPQPQEEVGQELHKPESTCHRNEGKEEVNQTGGEVEPSEKVQEVEMIENEHEETKEVKAEKMEINENIMSKLEDKSLKSAFTGEKETDEAQKEEPMKQTNNSQNLPDEEPVIQDDIESSEHDEGLKSDTQTELSEEEEVKTSFVTPLRWSRRLKHQATESKLTKRALRSATIAAKTSKTKAVKQHVETKQLVDDPEVEQMQEVLESHSETAVDEKIKLGSITTESEHVKAVEGKTQEQSAAEPVKQQEEEPASETGPAEDDNTEEATSVLKLQTVAVVLVDYDKVSTTHPDADKDTKGTSQPQEEVDLERHKLESTDTDCQAEHTEKQQVVEMTENEIRNSSTEETDEKVESKEGDVLNDEGGIPESAVTEQLKPWKLSETMEEVQKETDTVQEIPAEEPKSLHVIESSEKDESERSDVLIKLHEEEEDEVSSVTPLRHSRRLKDQGAESKLRKRVLRRSSRLTNKATPQQRHKKQIKAMMLEDNEQLDESKNDEIIILGSEVALGEHMESEAVHVFAEGDPENVTSAIQGTCEEGSNLEKDKADDHKNTSIYCGNKVEENIGSEDVTEQEKLAPKDIIHGEAEQIYTTGEKSAVDIGLSEVVKEVEGKVQEEGAATEMVHGENRENKMESTLVLTLQAASVVLMDVRVLPSLTGDCSYALQTAQVETGNRLEMSEQALDIPEDVMEELQIEDVGGDNIETESVNPTEGDPVGLNKGAKDTAEEDTNVVMSNLGEVTTDSSTFEEKKYIDEIKVNEVSETEQFTLPDPILIQESVLKECSVMTTCVQDVLDLHNTVVVKDNIFVEEKEEELTTELALEEDRENIDMSMSMLKLHKATVVLVDFQRQISRNETDENETIQEVAFLSKADEEKALVEMDGTESVTERKIVEDAVELSTDNTLIANNEQDQDILAEGVKDALKEVEDITLKESTSTELDANKTNTQDEDISVYASRNLRHRTLPVKATPEGKSRHLQKIYKETNVNENTEEEITDEVETVFIRHLRRRTITVTPRKRSKHLTGTRARDGEPKMEAHVTKVCHETVAVQRTEEARTAMEEIHENNSKCDSEEVPAVSEAAREDQQQEKNIPENDAEKLEEVNDGGKDMVEEAFETTPREIVVESDLPENQEKEEPEEPSQEEVRSANSELESCQQNNTLEEMVLEKKFEENLNKRVEEKHLEEEKDSTMNIFITEADPVQSEEGVGVEKRALRKRSITVKAASVRKYKRLRKQDQGENDGETDVWANTEDSALSGSVVMEMADVKSPTKNKTTDQGKGQELEDTNTIGGEISHKEENQENAGGEETSGEANNGQESTVTEAMSKQTQFSEFLNVSGEGTFTKLVAQEEGNGEENREEQPVTEEIMESEYNAGKADKVTDEPKEFDDTREESEQSETNAEGITEASVSVDENFTLELDEEINSNDPECNQVVKETKASFQESEKEITDIEQEPGVMTEHIHQGRRSARRDRIVLQDSHSELEDNSEIEEIKEVIGEEERKTQDKKRKGVITPSPRRSKRLAREEIM